ncbi:hypothetical protein COU61_04460 [Candidatus Pacearchaeota archaeon CG10_big_fil_rev_8_21_14_0_10_35_13]|nr:MAG: hypothetical protein COU61_04460 [Candidatus Pacearchaeota archaeon CG10_big_fil_rev_8_21_14_0_10_35_13]
MKKTKRILMITLISTLILLIVLIIILGIIRIINSKQLDDLSPGINCDEELIRESDVLFVIPEYLGKKISDDKEWCNKILSYNKTLALHGTTHESEEYLSDNETLIKEKINEGIIIFEECFNQTPKIFKAPQMKINKKNSKIVNEEGLKLFGLINQITHRAYHCNNTGIFSNKLIDIF